ncbi:MAG TPA: hypothetical protein VLJ79_02010 [Candidatus Binatia bacterium]|nr:hypothetical protein [Candidatus Binatia bacterium]
MCDTVSTLTHLSAELCLSLGIDAGIRNPEDIHEELKGAGLG